MEESFVLDIEQYIGCIPYILNKYHLPDEEFYDIAMYGLYKDCTSYDQEKAGDMKPQTYIIYGIKRYLDVEIRREARFHRRVYDSEQRGSWLFRFNEVKSDRTFLEGIKNSENTFVNRNNEIDDIFIEDSVNRFKSVLSEKERDILESRIIGMTLDEISQKYGVTKQRIGQIIQNIKRKAIIFYGPKKCDIENRKPIYNGIPKGK